MSSHGSSSDDVGEYLHMADLPLVSLPTQSRQPSPDSEYEIIDEYEEIRDSQVLPSYLELGSIGEQRNAAYTELTYEQPVQVSTLNKKKTIWIISIVIILAALVVGAGYYGQYIHLSSANPGIDAASTTALEPTTVMSNPTVPTNPGTDAASTTTLEPTTVRTTPTVPSQPELIWTISSDVRIRDIAILPDGSVVAACGSDGLRVYNRSGRIDHPVATLTVTGYIKGVSVTEDGDTVVAVESHYNDPAILHVYSGVGGGWTHIEYSSGCQDPWSVTIVTDGYIVGDWYSNTMCKYNTSGHLIWERDLPDTPWSLSSTDSGDIVARLNDGKIHVYSSTGVDKFTISTGPPGGRRNAGGVSSWHGRIYVSDLTTQSIYVYDMQGEFLHILMVIDREPYYIHIRHGMLAVSVYDGDEYIYMYTL